MHKGCKEDLRKLKKEYEGLRIEFKKAKQNTEIVNSEELVDDYRRRTKRITDLEEEIKALSAQEAEMKEVIDAYQRKIKKSSLEK